MFGIGQEVQSRVDVCAQGAKMIWRAARFLSLNRVDLSYRSSSSVAASVTAGGGGGDDAMDLELDDDLEADSEGQ